MLWDTHMHTHHSGDSDALMPDMIQAAVRQNLDGICFTDHFDYDYPDDPDLFLLDFDSYIKEVRSFQDTCHDRLSIRLGIEVGLQPHITEINRKAVTGHPFDFVIGSSHVVHGIDPYYPKYYEGRSEKTAYRCCAIRIVFEIGKFSALEASCCKVLVVNGSGAFFVRSPLFISQTLNSLPFNSAST